ncbi:hypothetical protein ACFOY2_14695 [Nonomuraea purpurea]|uniref:Uncharacterized protein n=1 Tax=Nonomuraea purpurea TaxID=1849276 RepID=A0ABV8G388_9ACTN
MSVHLLLSAGRGPQECTWALAQLLHRLEADAVRQNLETHRDQTVPGDRPGTYRLVPGELAFQSSQANDGGVIHHRQIVLLEGAGELGDGVRNRDRRKIMQVTVLSGHVTILALMVARRQSQYPIIGPLSEPIVAGRGMPISARDLDGVLGTWSPWAHVHRLSIAHRGFTRPSR